MSGYKPEYLRVRQELYNMIENDHSIKDKLPTEFELCEMFEVGRTTIRRALKLLTDEGLLIGKPGIGTFVAPKHLSHRFDQYGQKIHIGYTHESGRLMTFDDIKAAKFSSILNYLTQHNYIVDFVTFSGSGEDAVKELQQKGINHFIWTGPFSTQLETLRAIRDAGIQLILLECYPWEGFNVVATDGFKQGYLAAQYLLKRGRRSLLHITYSTEEDVYKWKDEGFAKALAEYDLNHPAGRTIVAEDLEKVLYYGGKVDGIFCQAACLQYIYASLNKHGIQLDSDCNIITTSMQADLPFIAERLSELSLIAAQKMHQIIEGKVNAPFQILLEPELIISDTKTTVKGVDNLKSMSV